MFHPHPFPPFFVFHVVGVAILLFGLATAARVLFRKAWCGRRDERVSAPGNQAFDDYRRATLKKLEREAEEFHKYLDRLRRASDAAAFEAFLRSRRAGDSAA